MSQPVRVVLAVITRSDNRHLAIGLVANVSITAGQCSVKGSSSMLSS